MRSCLDLENHRRREARFGAGGPRFGRQGISWTFGVDQGLESGRAAKVLAVEHELRQDVATDRKAISPEIREADRSRASGPPSSSEGMEPERRDLRRIPIRHSAVQQQSHG